MGINTRRFAVFSIQSNLTKVMIRFLALLCFTTSAFGLSLFPQWEPNLRVRFDANPLSSILNNAFMEQPLKKSDALKKGWEVKTRPDDGHKGFESLELLCPKGDYTFCLFFDDIGYVIGVQAGVELEQFRDSIYDWETQGFTLWTVDNGGTTEYYWTTQIFFSSPEYLLRSANDRVTSRNFKNLLQDKVIYVSGINKELHAIPLTQAELDDTAASNFTKQACMPLMGLHYYYQMTEDLECNDHLFPFFPLVKDSRVIGIGIVMYGKFTPKRGRTDYTENPPRLAVKAIVPRGPKCLYDLADDVGLVTMHIYFIDKPSDLTCPLLG